MSATDSLLLFQEFAQGTAKERVWLSRCGRAAALLDIANSADGDLCGRAIEVLNSCASNTTLDPAFFTARLDEALGLASDRLQILLLVCSGIATVQARSRGGLQLLELGPKAVKNHFPDANSSDWRRRELELRPDHSPHYVVCGNAFDADVLAKRNRAALGALNRSAWDKLFNAAALRTDWAALIFPVLSSLSYRDPTWPYDPFEGTQEQIPHERRGLAEIASALFKLPTFDGFRILTSPVMFRANADNLYDGLIVAPLGVFLFELKDVGGKVLLSQSERPIFYPRWPDKTGQRDGVNVFQRMPPDLRKLQGHPALNWLKGRDSNWLVGIGALVFSGTAEVVQLSERRNESPAVGFGPIVVATPATLGARLQEKALAGRKLENARRLSRTELDSIVKKYLGHERKPNVARKVGQYTLGRVREETPYVTTYTATMAFENTPVWISEFRPGSLVHADQAPAVAAATFRANIVLLMKLPREETRLQRAYETLERDGHLYAVVEAVTEPTLAEWLAGSPARAERVNLLRELAEVLVVLAEHGVTHRALGANTVHVRPGAKPVLTNFDFCHLNSVATLSAEARSSFDRPYMAPEADRPGSIITAAADIYSFGRLVCLALSGELPFDSYLKQATWARDPRAFPALAERCGLLDDAMLRRVLSPAASERPTASECLAWMTSC